MRSRSALPFAALALLLAACSSEADSTASSAAATTAPAITTAATTAPDATTEATTAVTTADTTADTTEPSTFTAQVWADNWFSLTVNGVLVGEDSVPITTERSFNAETITFSASYPLTIALVAKDYKESDSGLEYIGTDRQQMGDGGFIAQITDMATGAIVAATGSDWRGLVIHRAPLDTGCVSSAQPDVDCGSEITAEPAGWTEAAFDDSAWPTATEYTTTEVGTKDGYDTIAWDPSAALIWTSDLKVDNTILWRTVVPG